MAMRCGRCYLYLAEYEAVRIVCGDALLTVAWVCADEESCWERQDYNDLAAGVPLRRHHSWVVVKATTPEGEAVL
jgi:hypothetical protein